MEPPTILTKKSRKLPKLHFSPKLQKGTLQWYQSMLLEPIEVMDDNDELKKLIKSCVDDTTKKLMQGFKLMTNQLRGKVAAGGSRSFHNGETHKTIPFE